MNAAGRFTYLSARCRCSLVLLYNIFSISYPWIALAFDSSSNGLRPRLNFISCITQKTKTKKDCLFCYLTVEVAIIVGYSVSLDFEMDSVHDK